MSRNVKEQQRKMFSILRDFVPEDMQNKISNVKRTIFLSPYTYDVVENAKYMCSSVLLDERIALIKYNSHTYICAKRIPQSLIQNQSSYVNDQDLLYGIGILLFNEKMFTISNETTGYTVYDRIFGFTEDKEYKCEVIFELIQNYTMFEFNNQDFEMYYKEDLDRLLYMMFFYNNPEYGQNMELTSNILQILEIDSSKCIILILGNITQTRDTSMIFLQLYRCIEYLFIICKALDFSKKYDMETEMKKMVLMLDSEKIHFPENSCLYQIICQYASNKVIEEYYDYVCNYVNVGELKSEQKEKAVSDYIYSTRCKIAHFKYGQEKISDSETLERSNVILSKLVKSIFQKLDGDLMKINKDLDTFIKIGFMND